MIKMTYILRYFKLNYVTHMKNEMIFQCSWIHISGFIYNWLNFNFNPNLMNINDSYSMDEIHSFSNIFEPTPWREGWGVIINFN
jgi:hypothetical protein